MEHLIVPICNGFDPRKPNQPDAFSLSALIIAANLLREPKGSQGTALVVIRSVVKGPTGQIWWQAILERIQGLGIALQDVVIPEKESRNAFGDALAILEIAKVHPQAKIHIVVYSGGFVSRYLAQVYRGVAKYLEGRKLTFELLHSSWPETGFKSQLLYWALWVATWIASLSRPSFLAWYHFRQWSDRRRLKEFRRTVSE